MAQERPQRGGPQRGGRRGGGRGRGHGEQRDEFDQVILDLARVTRVMAGGKRMRFRACLVIGDRKGKVGVGIAKGADVQLAISKATNDAKKHMIRVLTTETGTIPHEVRIRDRSAQLLLSPAPAGTGVIAGSVVRQILELAGVRDVVAKIMGTSNKVNNAQTLMDALARLRKPRTRKARPQEAAAEEGEASPQAPPKTSEEALPEAPKEEQGA
ncbi:MAG: 30S ribosomal protein S5 [Patescibacteria group bacterium]